MIYSVTGKLNLYHLYLHFDLLFLEFVVCVERLLLGMPASILGASLLFVFGSVQFVSVRQFKQCDNKQATRDLLYLQAKRSYSTVVAFLLPYTAAI